MGSLCSSCGFIGRKNAKKNIKEVIKKIPEEGIAQYISKAYCDLYVYEEKFMQALVVSINLQNVHCIALDKITKM